MYTCCVVLGVLILVQRLETQQWNCGSVYITVSSIPPGKHLELNWNVECDNPPDVVSLLDQDPDTYPDSKAIVSVSTSDHPAGYYKTNVILQDDPLPGGWSWNSTGPREPGSHCLPHWIASYREGILVDSSCLQIRPTWISDHRSKFVNRPLTALFIPGTHNSGCDKLRTFTKRHSPIIERWGLTQDQDIWNQLVYGIRHLDIRVGHYPKNKNYGEDEDDRFWINHSFIQIRRLKPVLQQVASFVKASREIVIIDFHRFPTGFNGRNGLIVHRKLINLIKKELGEDVVYRPEYESKLTVGQILNTTGRVIVSYNQDSFIQGRGLWFYLTSGAEYRNLIHTNFDVYFGVVG